EPGAGPGLSAAPLSIGGASRRCVSRLPRSPCTPRNRAVRRGTEEPCAPELPLCTARQEAPAARDRHTVARLEQIEEEGKWKCFSYIQGHWNYAAERTKLCGRVDQF
ncbi:hypothetical protein NDU88_000546, partial [Pleurodeles waltl]